MAHQFINAKRLAVSFSEYSECDVCWYSKGRKILVKSAVIGMKKYDAHRSSSQVQSS
jgi:hypothetical protein